MVSALIPMIRVTAYWPELPTFTSSMIITARRAFSPPTMSQRYERHLATGRPLPDQTQAFVAALATMIESKQTGPPDCRVVRSVSWFRLFLFVARTASNSSDVRISSNMRPDLPLRARTAVDLAALVPQSS